MPMLKSLTALLALAGLAMSASASATATNATGEAALAKILAGRVAGKPVDCVLLSQLGASQIVDGTAIVYHGDRGTLYVNRPPGASLLRRDSILVTHPYGSQLCRLDLTDLVDRYTQMPMGSVSMGAFVPYTKAPSSH